MHQPWRLARSPRTVQAFTQGPRLIFKYTKNTGGKKVIDAQPQGVRHGYDTAETDLNCRSSVAPDVLVAGTAGSTSVRTAAAALLALQAAPHIDA